MKATVYTTPTCGYCRQAKEFLKRQGVSFVEKNVAADRNAAMEMVRISGQQGVPVIALNGQVVVGFDQPRLMQILKNSEPQLGASVADAARQARKHPGIPTSGAFIGRVRNGSPAERAGLRPGDVVTGLGGQPVVVADDLYKLVSEMPKERDLSLTFVRNGEQRESLIRL